MGFAEDLSAVTEASAVLAVASCAAHESIREKRATYAGRVAQ